MPSHNVIVKFFGNKFVKKYNCEKTYKTFDPISVGPSTDSLDTWMPYRSIRFKYIRPLSSLMPQKKKTIEISPIYR